MSQKFKKLSKKPLKKYFDETGIQFFRASGDYPTSKAIKLHPNLIKHLRTRYPSRINKESRETLLLYNFYIAKDLYGLKIEFEKENAIIPTPKMRYNFLRLLKIPKNSSIIEIGTGASAIIAMLAAKHFGAEVHASEVDKNYIEYAKRNIKNNNLEKKIQIYNSHDKYLDGVFPKGMKVDFIISNPPYYDEIISPKKLWGGKTHELVGNGDYGEEFIVSMIDEGWKYLKTPGIISFIIPKTRIDTLVAVEDCLNKKGFDYEIIGLLAGNRTRYIFKIFKRGLIDELRLSEMND